MTSRVVANEDILIHQFDDEAVLLDLHSETYYALNEAGIRMWQALTSSDSIEAAYQLLIDQYDAPPETLWLDFQEFIEQLKSDKLIVVHE